MEFHPSLLKLCLGVLCVILQSHRCLGCEGDERTALLEIQAFIRSQDLYILAWGEGKTSDYCYWNGIKCSNTSGCVSQLDLGTTFIASNDGDTLINVSLFLPFKDLEHLDLSYNHINGTKGDQGFEKLAKLKKLQVLNLAGNRFNSNVLGPLSELTSLRTLNLDDNYLGESSSSEISQGFEKLAKLKKLQVLDLGWNHFNTNVLEHLGELTSIRILNLYANNIGESSSSEISQGFEKLAKLKKLKVLDLGGNNFNSSILEPLSELTSLGTLKLDLNNLGESSAREISQGFEKLLKLKRLQFLDLQKNSLNHTSILLLLSKLTSLQNLNLHQNQLGMGSSIEISQGFCELKKLQQIDLSENYLYGEIPLCLVNFTSLRILDLSNNQLRGNIPMCLVNSTPLRILDLSDNQLGETIPTCLSNATSLGILDLSNNLLGGNIPTSLTSNMTSLERLDFSGNQFTGSIPPSLLQNLTSLQHLSFSNNQFEGTSLITSMFDQNFQLKSLGLSNCNLNTSTTSLLKFLHGQTQLQHIDLSHNNIHGNFPLWLIANNAKLTTMILNNNSLSGDIHFPLRLPTNLLWIDVSKNHIEGHLQTNLGDVLQGVKYLNLSQNHLEGSIPTSLGNSQLVLDLDILDLSNNHFTGEIPRTLGGPNIAVLMLSNNRLHGQIYLDSLSYKVVRLSNNQITGIVPYSTDFTLHTLDVSKNNISGRIPSWIANLRDVRILVMGDNSFHGPIPLELCNLAFLEYLDLSQNELSGNIPSCLNLPFLRSMQFQGNKLSGSLPSAILRSPNLETLNLNHNNFSGSIPGWLGSLENLGILLLNRNRLSGFVPYELCKSSRIWILDISHNGLSGKIPPCLSSISFGKSRLFQHDSGDGFYIGFPGGNYTDNTFGSGSYESQEEVEFMTKGLSLSYKGDILNYMSGMDLSCNNFIGHIPPELGALTAIHALNLSHNQLTGPIPKTLSKLKQLESMDLSHNKLSGEVPSELTDLSFLGTFVVAYNNLSGSLPNMNQQPESSYEGNPYLCGPPLLKQCNGVSAPTGSGTTTDAALSDVFGVDLISFLASCAGAYVMSILALVIVLYINPYWRRLWFDSIDACLSFIFPFWAEDFYRVSNPFT